MNSFVAYLSKADQEKLYRLGEQVSYGAGEALMRQGEPGNHVYLIDSGHVQVVKFDFDGKKSVLNSCRPGDLVGEIACFHRKGVRSASVIAQGAVAAIRIAKDAFLAFLDQHPVLWRGLVERMAELLLKAEDEPDNRSIRVLSAVAAQAERHAGGGRAAVVPLSQEGIAEIAHVSPVTAYRVLADLKRRELASSQRGKGVVVRCVPCLRAAADEAVSTQIYGQLITGCGGVDDCPRR